MAGLSVLYPSVLSWLRTLPPSPITCVPLATSRCTWAVGRGGAMVVVVGAGGAMTALGALVVGVGFAGAEVDSVTGLGAVWSSTAPITTARPMRPAPFTV